MTLTASGRPTGTSTWASTTGRHTLSATVDDQGLLAESNETNNKRQIQLNVGAIPSLPDLVANQRFVDAFVTRARSAGPIHGNGQEYRHTFHCGWHDYRGFLPPERLSARRDLL